MRAANGAISLVESFQNSNHFLCRSYLLHRALASSVIAFSSSKTRRMAARS